MQTQAPGETPVAATVEATAVVPSEIFAGGGEQVERRVPMTRLRASVAKRLVEAQQNAAMLTTFEVDMQPIMQLRKRYQTEFQAARNGTKRLYVVLCACGHRGTEAVPLRKRQH